MGEVEWKEIEAEVGAARPWRSQQNVLFKCKFLPFFTSNHLGDSSEATPTLGAPHLSTSLSV